MARFGGGGRVEIVVVVVERELVWGGGWGRWVGGCGFGGCGFDGREFPNIKSGSGKGGLCSVIGFGVAFFRRAGLM